MDLIILVLVLLIFFQYCRYNTSDTSNLSHHEPSAKIDKDFDIKSLKIA